MSCACHRFARHTAETRARHHSLQRTGSEANEIILENNNGISHPVSAKTLSGLFAVLKDNIRYVVLNACYSQGQAEAIAELIVTA